MNSLSFEKQGHIALVGLNRPEKYNGLNMAMIDDITEVIDQIKADKTIRAVVLFGEGKGFCAGLDFGEVAQNPANIPMLLSKKDGNIANKVQQIAFGWTEIEVPVIAALHGPVFGGGFQIAMGADIRIADETASLSVMEIKWGIIPDMSISTTLPKILPMDQVKELIWTGRRVDAKESLEKGLVTQIAADAKQAAIELAKTIAGKNPHAIAAGKTLLNQADGKSNEEKLILEETLQKTLLGQPNQMEAMQANFMKRDPEFKDRT